MFTISVTPAKGGLRPLILDQQSVRRIWGTALASHLKERRVAERIARAATQFLEAAGYHPDIETLYEETAAQPGAAFTLFAELEDGVCLGADMAGAAGRRSETIGQEIAKQLLNEICGGATLDRHAADQIIPFAAMAHGETMFQVTAITEHMRSNAWLANEFLGAEGTFRENVVSVAGIGLAREPTDRLRRAKQQSG